MVDLNNLGKQLGDAAKNIDPKQAEQAIDAASGAAKKATGGKFDQQIDAVADKAADVIKGNDNK